jgi:glycerol-3-phosphate O-acyltransferase
MFASQKMVKSLEGQGEVIYQVEDLKRPEMAFYKNTLINWVAGRSIVACALLSSSDNSLGAIRDRALFLSRLFKFELIYPVGKPFEAIFNETVEHLSNRGLLKIEGSTLQTADDPAAKPMLVFLSELIRDYLESYWLTAKMAAVATSATPKKDFIKAALAQGKSDYFSGTLVCGEALSRTTLENAVQFLVDQKIAQEQDKNLVVKKEDAQTLMDTIRTYLGE